MKWLPLGKTQAGVDEFYGYDAASKKVLIKASQDLQGFVDANRAAQNDGTNGFRHGRAVRTIANVPEIVVQIWSKKWGLPPMGINRPEYRDLLARELKDPDNRAFLTVDNDRFNLKAK